MLMCWDQRLQEQAECGTDVDHIHCYCGQSINHMMAMQLNSNDASKGHRLIVD